MDERKPCCQDPGNLQRDKAEERNRPGLVCMRCQVCQCRHFELTVEPGVLGLRGESVG